MIQSGRLVRGSLRRIRLIGFGWRLAIHGATRGTFTSALIQKGIFGLGRWWMPERLRERISRCTSRLLMSMGRIVAKRTLRCMVSFLVRGMTSLLAPALLMRL